jgi:hypothetical protein
LIGVERDDDPTGAHPDEGNKRDELDLQSYCTLFPVE